MADEKTRAEGYWWVSWDDTIQGRRMSRVVQVLHGGAVLWPGCPTRDGPRDEVDTMPAHITWGSYLGKEEPQAPGLREVAMHRAGWAAGLRAALKLHIECPDLSAMELLERGIADVDAHGVLATNLEHLAIEIQDWIDLANEIVKPDSCMDNRGLRDALRLEISAAYRKGAEDCAALGKVCGVEVEIDEEKGRPRLIFGDPKDRAVLIAGVIVMWEALNEAREFSMRGDSGEPWHGATTALRRSGDARVIAGGTD